ncbi:MAG: hypothetical protein QGI95_02165 [Dehalococcoidales bacterium]|nr:hypothetical protein [Dehalococcoidales bacterium]MDP6824917.1 hypothetical protein [Dehalococcoidales bacterium]
MGERLKGKVAIVTSAGSVLTGIGNGKATAIVFAREGARVMAVDYNLEAAEETRQMIARKEVPVSPLKPMYPGLVTARAWWRPASRSSAGLTSSTTTLVSDSGVGSWRPTRRPGTG